MNLGKKKKQTCDKCPVLPVLPVLLLLLLLLLIARFAWQILFTNVRLVSIRGPPIGLWTIGARSPNLQNSLPPRAVKDDWWMKKISMSARWNKYIDMFVDMFGPIFSLNKPRAYIVLFCLNPYQGWYKSNHRGTQAQNHPHSEGNKTVSTTKSSFRHFLTFPGLHQNGSFTYLSHILLEDDAGKGSNEPPKRLLCEPWIFYGKPVITSPDTQCIVYLPTFGW